MAGRFEGSEGRAYIGVRPRALRQLYLSRQRLEPARRALEQNLKDAPAAPDAAQVEETVEKLKEALKQSPRP